MCQSICAKHSNDWQIVYTLQAGRACQARTRPGAQQKINVDVLKSYVKENPDIKLRDVASKFGVSTWTIHYWLKKWDLAIKKKLHLLGVK